MKPTKEENHSQQTKPKIIPLGSSDGKEDKTADTRKGFDKEITDKILKEAIEKTYKDAEFDTSYKKLAEGFLKNSSNCFTLEIIKKAISLTLAECQKQNSNFVKKLKEEILIAKCIINYDVNWMKEQIDKLAKSELGVGEE